MKKQFKNLITIMAFGLIFGFFLGTLNSIPIQKSAKPDLKVQSITVNQIGKAKNGGIKVNIKVIIKNISKSPTKTGFFKLGLKYQDGQIGPFKNLKSKLIPSLDTNPKLQIPAMKVLIFQDTVPAGIKRKYQADIDPDKQLIELSRNNNTMHAEFNNPNSRTLANNGVMSARAFPPCDGVDIVLWRIEIRRNENGQIILRGRAKNLCTGICNGRLDLLIERSETGPLGIEQFLGSSLAGEALSLWSGWLEVHPRSDDRGAHTYTLSVRVGAPCVDRNPDNRKIITLAAGENFKTVNYHDR